MTRALRRLLEALSEAGACAAPSDLEDDTIVVLAPRNGVTVVRARLPAAAGEAALSQGLAEWARREGSRVGGDENAANVVNPPARPALPS